MLHSIQNIIKPKIIRKEKPCTSNNVLQELTIQGIPRAFMGGSQPPKRLLNTNNNTESCSKPKSSAVAKNTSIFQAQTPKTPYNAVMTSYKS